MNPFEKLLLETACCLSEHLISAVGTTEKGLQGQSSYPAPPQPPPQAPGYQGSGQGQPPYMSRPSPAPSANPQVPPLLDKPLLLRNHWLGLYCVAQNGFVSAVVHCFFCVQGKSLLLLHVCNTRLCWPFSACMLSLMTGASCKAQAQVQINSLDTNA